MMLELKGLLSIFPAILEYKTFLRTLWKLIKKMGVALTTGTDCKTRPKILLQRKKNSLFIERKQVKK